MRQDRSTPITETAEEPTGGGPDGYGSFAHHHRSVLDRRRSGLTSAEQAWVRHQIGNRTGRDRLISWIPSRHKLISHNAGFGRFAPPAKIGSNWRGDIF